MFALITGASGGIGYEIAERLGLMGYNLILAARSKLRLEEAKNNILKKTNNNIEIEIMDIDISVPENCFKIFEKVKNKDIEILINNAGYGAFGHFDAIDIDTDLNMIDLNIKSVCILTKLFLNYFKERKSGYIMNVASAAAFAPGPMLADYYATKAYVLRLTQAVYEELRRTKSKIKICALCPGPVDTGFNKRAGVKFTVGSLKPDFVAKYALKNMFKGKLTIIPGLSIKFATFMSRIAPIKPTLRIVYGFQKKKID